MARLVWNWRASFLRPKNNWFKHEEYKKERGTLNIGGVDHKENLTEAQHRGEAAKMKKTLQTQKVPAEKIIEEPLATNTREHVKYILL